MCAAKKLFTRGRIAPELGQDCGEVVIVGVHVVVDKLQLIHQTARVGEMMSL